MYLSMQNIVHISTGGYDYCTQSVITTNTINDKCTQGPKVESKYKACTASRKKMLQWLLHVDLHVAN